MKKEDFCLNNETYHTPEANLKYLDCSTYKNIVGTLGRKGCECRALAIARGEYEPPKTEALLVGSYVDAYFDNSLDEFKKKNINDLFSKTSIKKYNEGKIEFSDLELLTAFKNADVMIQRAIREPLFMRYVEGETQKILMAEIGGLYRISYTHEGKTEVEEFEHEKDAKKRIDEVKARDKRLKKVNLETIREPVPIRVKLDSYDGHRITDIKTSASITQTWYVKDLSERLNFAEYFGYIEQAYFYQTAVEQSEGKHLPFYLAVITKEKVDAVPHPRVAVIQIPDAVIEEMGERIKSNIHKAWAILQGEYEPIPCGCCEWCADNLPLTEVISLDELMLEV